MMDERSRHIPVSDGQLLCPACGFNYSHIRKAYTELGSDEDEAVIYEGTLMGGRTTSRRSALVIEIEGECEHQWKIRIQQHKGNNFVEVETFDRPAIYPSQFTDTEDLNTFE